MKAALIAGTLGQGGAEKQLYYQVRALLEAGHDVRLYSLTRGEYYEPAFQALGVEPVWFGQSGNPLLRLIRLWILLRNFRPQMVQSAHFYTTPYAALTAKLLGAASIGGIRGDTMMTIDDLGRLGRTVLRMPSLVLVNSQNAYQQLLNLGLQPERVDILLNVLDLEAYQEQAHEPVENIRREGEVIAMTVARLVPVKRLEKFLQAVAAVRSRGVPLRGVLVGDGPLRPELESKAQSLGLVPDGVTFLGSRSDVPALLPQADLFVLTSETEGFPNAILEAMAAHLPVVTTPAGDAPTVVENSRTGWVVPFEDQDGLAAAIRSLAENPDLRKQMGELGYHNLLENYTLQSLDSRLLKTYRRAAENSGNRRLISHIEQTAGD